jgi:hypothetical protein
VLPSHVAAGALLSRRSLRSAALAWHGGLSHHLTFTSLESASWMEAAFASWVIHNKREKQKGRV